MKSKEPFVPTNKAASALSHLYWDKLSKQERSARVPRNGGRKRKYPRCERYGAHRFSPKGRCPCGYVRERTEQGIRGAPPEAPKPESNPEPNPVAHMNGASSVSPNSMTPEQAKAIIRGLVAQYGLHWAEDVPASALELLEQAARVLTDEQKRELFLTISPTRA